MMNQRLTYRAELLACNLAIQTLGYARPIRSAIQKGARILQTREVPIWLSTLAASSICGLLAGFTLYVLIAIAR